MCAVADVCFVHCPAGGSAVTARDLLQAPAPGLSHELAPVSWPAAACTA